MYSKKSILNLRFSDPILVTANSDDTKVYRPLSYYVSGGIDVTGEGLVLDAHVEYDSAEDLASTVGPDSRCDPRVSFFDIAEEVGIRAAKAAEESKA